MPHKFAKITFFRRWSRFTKRVASFSVTGFPTVSSSADGNASTIKYSSLSRPLQTAARPDRPVPDILSIDILPGAIRRARNSWPRWTAAEKNAHKYLIGLSASLLCQPFCCARIITDMSVVPADTTMHYSFKHCMIRSEDDHRRVFQYRVLKRRKNVNNLTRSHKWLLARFCRTFTSVLKKTHHQYSESHL